MNLHIELLIAWIILIAVGVFLMYNGLITHELVILLGKVLVVVGVIVFIVWIVKVVASAFRTGINV